MEFHEQMRVCVRALRRVRETPGPRPSPPDVSRCSASCAEWAGVVFGCGELRSGGGQRCLCHQPSVPESDRVSEDGKWGMACCQHSWPKWASDCVFSGLLDVVEYHILSNFFFFLSFLGIAALHWGFVYFLSFELNYCSWFLEMKGNCLVCSKYRRHRKGNNFICWFNTINVIMV